MPNVKAPPKESVSWNIGQNHQWQYVPQKVEDLNVVWDLFDWAYIRYDVSQNAWVYIAWWVVAEDYVVSWSYAAWTQTLT